MNKSCQHSAISQLPIAGLKRFLYSPSRNPKFVRDVGNSYFAFSNFTRVFSKSQLVN